MITEMAATAGSDAQREPRTNLFVMAAIYADSGSAPVKVRNVSAGGALIEGPVVPPHGSRVRLCRGAMSVSAQVVWSKDGRAGLRFESTVTVADWLPGGQARGSQQQVDNMVQQVKASQLAPVLAGPILQSCTLSALDLAGLSAAVESLAEDLARDPAVVHRHMLKLQTLDLAAQALRKLAVER